MTVSSASSSLSSTSRMVCCPVMTALRRAATTSRLVRPSSSLDSIAPNDLGNQALSCAKRNMNDRFGFRFRNPRKSRRNDVTERQQPAAKSRRLTLAGELVTEPRLGFGHEATVAFRIDEGISGRARPLARTLGIHVVERTVNAQEDIAGQRLPDLEATREVLGDLRIADVADEAHTRIDVGARKEHDVEAAGDRSP